MLVYKSRTMKGFRVLCFFLLVLVVLAGCSRDLKETYMRGDQYLSRGEFGEAYKTFRKVVSRGGDSRWAARALLKLAQMERSVYHRPQKALEYCQKLVKGSYPGEFSREARLLMAQIQAEDLNHPMEGLKILEGIRDAPGDLERQRLMVEYAIKGGDLEKAARLARAFLERNGGKENLRFALILADLFENAGDYRHAEELYNRVKSRARGDLAYEAIMGLANLREDQGRLKEALALLKELEKDGSKPALVEVKMRHIRRRLREERG